MPHCPYCGTHVKENETYCVKCGKMLPADMFQRIHDQKGFNKWWLLPIVLAVGLIAFTGIFHFMLNGMDIQAEELYEQGEESALEGDYEEAEELFRESLDQKDNFPQAKTALAFSQSALNSLDMLEKADTHLEKKNYEKALTSTNDAENDLNEFNGEAVSSLIDRIGDKRNQIQIARLEAKLEDDPSIDELKTLIWDAEAINNKRGEEITANIREQIVSYTFSKASEELSDKQFENALTYVEDGLKYAPESDKLHSLETTIDKEKVAFETAQEKRIEQAISTAEEEQQHNENDAVKIADVSVDRKNEDELTVQGEVESVATIPINSIVVEYSLLSEEDGKEIITNNVYVVPDTLYPDEEGTFEFTHYDVDATEAIEVQVDTIKWYTE